MPKHTPETFCPSSQEDWRNWLEEHHQTKSSVWLIYYRKSTNIPSLSWGEAVDEALCFGWIDSTKKTIDEERYMQYFTKRKPKSNWSKVNKDKIEKLIQNGHMREAGFESIEIAKENGSWTLLDAVEALIVPDDLAEGLAVFPGTRAFFDSLSKSHKKSLLYWVISAKRKETRQKRILQIVESAGEKKMPKQFW